MKFREGDKVEFIWSGKLKQGVVTEIEETKNAISYQIKYSGDMGMTWLDERDLIAPAQVLNVPRFADDWIKHCKQREYDLACLLDYEDSDMSAEMNDWLSSEDSNQELLVRAWLDGYEVEKEPLYYVHFLEGIGGYLNMRYDGLMRINGKDQDDEYKTQFTEAEIKSMKKGKGYWLLREPVEEVEGEEE
ncbi:DUF1642 domain-containing protein [Listeria monocytogenes]|uniref:DUF1642 domain-containing protein n=1 Tax=Listeria innocua TaxID=1642 RepID=UPI0010B41ABE|nr:DUF1642 domain-containing protein [Listeria innocua]EAC5011923.1 DUF1642 domain-containing protein [Listeria monocytogenes]EHY7660187.1 DUF1642 domain-containing protein [Listeria monocytogenes]EHY7829134.1 DUF1642 domain-containing protein [Listeria monocytogenes]